MVGDFLFQNKWMALGKGEDSLKCLVHCLIYTATVGLFTNYNPYWMAVVFLSHYPIDRWSLGEVWLKFINGRSLGDFIRNGKKDIPMDLSNADLWDNYITLRGSFSALVYAAVDNTMHLLLMYYGYKGLQAFNLL